MPHLGPQEWLAALIIGCGLACFAILLQATKSLLRSSKTAGETKVVLAIAVCLIILSCSVGVWLLYN
jgi:hypothetical protein